MGKKPDQISASLHRYLPLISLAAFQPHPPPPLPQFRYSSCAKLVSRRQSTVQNYPPPPSPRSFAPQRSASSSSSITIPPERWLKNSPFLSPISVLSRISYTPESSRRRPPRSSISAVCASQIDRLFLLLPVFSRGWNVDELRTRWLGRTWMG